MPRKTLTLTFATLLAALILPPYAWAGPFDTGLYTSKGADNLISSLRVSNQSAGRQRLLETNNTLIDLGSCKFQVNIVSERAVPANYNQSDYLPGKFVSCAFLNDTCGFGTCTSDNIALLPGKYYKQGSNQLCGVWKHGTADTPPQCYTKAGEMELDVTIGGVQLQMKP